MTMKGARSRKQVRASDEGEHIHPVPLDLASMVRMNDAGAFEAVLDFWGAPCRPHNPFLAGPFLCIYGKMCVCVCLCCSSRYRAVIRYSLSTLYLSVSGNIGRDLHGHRHTQNLTGTEMGT